MKKEILAVMDIGSNSVRMVVYDLGTMPPRHLYNEKTHCPLGRDLGITGKLAPDAAENAVDAIRTYRVVAQSFEGAALKIVATAALRDATDGAAFADRLCQETGISEVRILTGDEEAAYAAEGVLFLEPEAEGIVVDFGGGSLELARITNGQVGETVSLPLGAFRVKALGDEAEEKLRRIFSAYKPVFGGARALYAIGGMARTLAQAHKTANGRTGKLQGYSLSPAVLTSFCHEIGEASLDRLETHYDIAGHRAGLAPVTALVLRLLVEELEPAAFVISGAGVRDGIVHEFLSHKTKVT